MDVSPGTDAHRRMSILPRVKYFTRPWLEYCFVIILTNLSWSFFASRNRRLSDTLKTTFQLAFRKPSQEHGKFLFPG